jgi:hypothetical protein
VSSVSRTAAGLAAATGVLLLLAACTPQPTPTVSPPSTPPSAPTAPSVALLPEGTAADNLAFFTATAQPVWESEQRGEGRAYIDALVAAGFDRDAMQVTNDQSTVGNPVESLQFSVRWGATECLIGQVGPSTGQLVTQVMPQLAEGRCLIGATRPIDW